MNWSVIWTAVGGGGGAVLALLAVAQLVGKPLRKLLRQNDEFRQDWYGQPARPGVPAEAGVMERLGNIEHKVDSLPDRVSRVETALADHIRGHPTTPVVVVEQPRSHP